jgi:hypothetical protein
MAYGVSDSDIGFGEGGEGRLAELRIERPLAMLGNVLIRTGGGEVAPVTVMGSEVVGPGGEEEDEEIEGEER